MEYGLSLGSNEGDRLSCLKLTIEKIRLMSDVSVAAQSRIYETEPVNVPDEHQDKPFLNCAVIIESSLAPADLLKEIHDLEVDMGRQADHPVNTPRTIDIDIVYAGDLIVDTPELTIPHPHCSERRFVIEPLADLRPDLILPKTNRTTKDILKSLPKTPKVSLLK